MESGITKKNIPSIFLVKSLLFSYILTAALLLLLTFLVYRAGMTEKMVSLAIIAIYVMSTFFAGFITGKKMQSRKFLWGLLMGSIYYLVLLVLSVLCNHTPGGLENSMITTFILCAAGGMLGGMLS